MTSIKKIMEIGEKTRVKLEKNGYKTCEDLMKTTPKKLAKEVKIGQGVAEKLIDKAEEIVGTGVDVTGLSEESLAYLKKLENEELNPSFGGMQVEKWYNDISNGHIMVNHKYQRKPNQWSSYLNQLFLITLFEHGVIPPLVIADLSLIDSTKKKELVDGQQRYTLMKKWFNNEIKLPLYLPSDLGGGKVRSECPVETRDRIDKHMVWFMEITPKTEEQIYNLYNRIQKGVRLTFGQDIRGHQGTFKQLVTELSQHPFVQNIYGREEDWELQIAGYLYLDILFDDGVNKLNNFQRDHLTQYLEEHSEDEVSQFIYDVCFERADKLNEIFKKHNLSDLRNVQVIALSRCLNKQFTEYPDVSYFNMLCDAFADYVSKLEECKLFNQLEKKPENPFDEKYVHKIKTSLYYPLSLKKLSINEGSKTLVAHSELIWMEFQSKINEN